MTKLHTFAAPPSQAGLHPGPHVRHAFVTGSALAVMLGTACADGAQPGGLTFEQWHDPDVPSVFVPFDSIEAAPRLRLDSVAHLEVSSPTDQMIRSVVTLPHGTLAFTVDGTPSIAYVDSAGSTIKPGTELGGPSTVPWLVPGRGDTLFVKDVHWLRVAPDGDIIDTLRVEGTVIGALEEGSAVIWHVESGPKPEYGMETMRVTARRLPPNQIRATDPRIQPLFTGIMENLAHFGVPMPWARWTAAGVAAGKLWVSPTGGPRLVGIGSDGRVHRVVAWATPDTVVDTVEVRAWKATGASDVGRYTRLSEAVRQDRLAEIEAVQPNGQPARVVVMIRGGRDGTIWVRLRRRWGSTAPFKWIGLDTLGTVRGVLTMPDRIEVLEFGANYVIVVPDGRKSFRRHRIVEVPTADAGG